MPATEQLASTLHHRKSRVVRKLESELELLHTDHRKTAKQRWSTCFAFIFRRSKFKSTDHPFVPSSFYPSSTSSCTFYSSTSTSTTAISANFAICNNNVDNENENENDNDNDNDNASTGKSLSVEKPTYHPITTSLPPTPASSLSPPPRKHIMTRQCRTKTLTPLDYTFSTCTSAPILPVNPPLQRRLYIPRPSVLRLSLDVDQRYSYTSSIYSSDSHGADLIDGSDNDNQSFLQDTSTTIIERRRQRQQQQRYFSWIEEKTAPWISTEQQQQQTDSNSDHEEDDVYSAWHSQISKDKAHYDAIVASTMHHRHFSKEKDQLLPLDTRVDTILDTPPSSAPLSLPQYFLDKD